MDGISRRARQRRAKREAVVAEPTAYQRITLLSLQGRKVYEGTVGEADKAKRRQRGRVAKQSRKLNRGTR